MELKEPIEDYGKLDLNGSYTYWDYLRWNFSERVELIRGKIRLMSPGPNTNHQRVVVNSVFTIGQLFKSQPCEFFSSPFAVRLPIPKAAKDTTVVQPDFCIVCDPNKIDKQGCNGAPDLVAEILSPGNSAHELETKFNLYEQSSVREYWILQPAEKTVFILTAAHSVSTDTGKSLNDGVIGL